MRMLKGPKYISGGFYEILFHKIRLFFMWKQEKM